MSTSANTAVIGLDEKTIDKLRELRRLNVDSAKGFEECAELVKDHGVKQAFTEIAHDRRQQAQTLGAQIEWNEGEEEEDGSYLAAAHRTWIKVREACSSDDVEAILAEAKRGESTLADAYEDTMGDVKGSPIFELIAKQREDAKKVVHRLDKLCEAK